MLENADSGMYLTVNGTRASMGSGLYRGRCGSERGTIMYDTGVS